MLFLTIYALLTALLASEPKAEIVFAGDAMMHQRQIDSAMVGDDLYDYSSCFEAITPYVENADFAVVNLETPLGGAPYSGYPMFCAPDSYLDALRKAGFDLFLTANNHTLDRRDKGLKRTIGVIEAKKDILHIGTYRSAAHRDSILPLIKDIAGFKVAFLNYTYGTNGISKTTPVEIDYIDRNRISRDIKTARAKGAEIVTVCIHWGDEYHLLPNQGQKYLANWLATQGVDLIIGGHPHVIQPMQLVDNPVTGGKTLTVYSLGNFISAMRTTDTRGGAMVKVRLARDAAGKAIVEGADYRLVFTVPPTDDNHNFHLLPAECNDMPASWHQNRDAFLQNALKTFDAYNIDVPRDSSAIGRKWYFGF